MFLHLGAEVSVFLADVIGIFDYRLAKYEAFNEFLNFTEWGSQVITIPGEPKSIVVAAGKVYFTPVSRTTLVRRWAKQGF